jgi:hypothetical protein
MRTVLLTTMLLMAGCRTATPPLLLERAVVTREHVEAAIVVEKKLAPVYEILPAPGEQWFEVLTGTRPVLIVAGHATAQTREGDLKVADRGTGSLAVALHEMTDATVIYTTKRSPSDPNYYDDNDFKRALDEMIRKHKPVVVLDLHGSHGYRPYDVDFGIMGGRSLLGRHDLLRDLVDAIRNEGMLNLSQDYFAAAKNQTVTKFASERGIPAIQLEITSTRLDPSRDVLTAHRFAQILQALVRFVSSFSASSAPLR